MAVVPASTSALAYALMSSHEPARHRFATTSWSVVLAAGRHGTAEAEQALGRLCETYWFPLYAYVRRCGQAPADAQDLTQAFFAQILEKHSLDSADQTRGRFRTFLLVMLKRFLSNQKREARALRRGGGRTILSLDFDDGERRFALEPADGRTPEHVFEQRWALTVLDRVLDGLRQDYAARDKLDLFDTIKHYLTSRGDNDDYERIAAELGMSLSAVKVAVHRLRQRYGDMLRSEVAATVASDGEVDSELDDLLSALRGNRE